MNVEQLLVVIENRRGSLAEVAGLLAENGLNIRAISLADTPAPAATLRMIVNDTEKAKKVLMGNGVPVRPVEVVVIEVADKPGGLAGVLDTALDAGLNIEYMYAFSQKSGESGLVIFEFDDPPAAVTAFAEAGIRILTDEEVHAL